MNVTVPLSTWRWHRAAMFAFMLVACLGTAYILRIPWLEVVPDRDQMGYATIGHFLGWDTLPYRDLLENKQPLTYVFYAIFDDLWPAPDFTPYRVISAMLAGLAAYFVFVLAAPLMGAARALLAAALAVVIGASGQVQGGDLNVEHLVLPFVVLSALLPLALREKPWRWLPFASGLIGSVLLLTQLTLVPAGAAGLVPLLLFREARGQSARATVLWYAAGLFGPGVLVILFYAARRALGDLIDANWTLQRNYGETNTLSLRWDRLNNSWELWLLIFAAAAIGALRLRERGWRTDVLGLTLMAWLAGGVLGIVAPGSGFEHYYVPIVPVCAALLALAPGTARLGGAAATAVMAVLAIALVFPFAREDARNFGRDPAGLAYHLHGESIRFWDLYDDVGAVLRERADPGDKLFVTVPEPGYYWASGLRPATPLLHTKHMGFIPGFGEEVRRTLCRYPPRFLILGTGFWPPELECLRTRVKWGEVMKVYSLVVLDRPRGPLELPPPW
ncbi:MAG TPA: hypothetical protein VF587_09570 [Solirubrobacteraceae bacterium]